MEPTIVDMEDVEINATAEWLTYIQLAYGIPSLILLISSFFLIAFGKKYKNNSFYRLVLFDLSTNILLYINTWVAIRIELHPSMIPFLKFVQEKLPGLLTFLKYIPYWFFHMHFWTAALLTIHRMTSLLFPLRYEHFWTRYYWIIVAVCCVYSHLPSYIWRGNIYEVYIRDGQLICINFNQALDVAITVVAVFSSFYFCLNLINGLATAFLAAKSLEASTLSQNHIKKKLTLISITYSCVYTAEVVWSILNFVDSFLHFMPPVFKKINTNLLVFASDLFTLSLPYILLIFDTNVKKDVFPRKGSISPVDAIIL